jgi:hypothetical protein
MDTKPSMRRYSRNPEFVYRRIGDELLLVPIRQNAAEVQSIYSLNETGGYVWEALDGQRTVADITQLVVDAFEVSETEAEPDIENLIHHLVHIGAAVEEC